MNTVRKIFYRIHRFQLLPKGITKWILNLSNSSSAVCYLDHGLLAISDVKSSRAVIGDVLKKYRDAKGDVVHVRHDTPDGAPLFTPGTELAEEFSELSQGGENEKVC